MTSSLRSWQRWKRVELLCQALVRSTCQRLVAWMGPLTQVRAISSAMAAGGDALQGPFPTPVEVSSGKRKVHRLSRRGSRRTSHAIHMAGMTQVRHAHSEGRACYEKKISEGKTAKEALRAPKRRISDAIYRPAPAARPKEPSSQASEKKSRTPWHKKEASI